MKTSARLLLSLAVLAPTLFAGIALPAEAQQTGSQSGADPAFTQQADPALAKMVPAA